VDPKYPALVPIYLAEAEERLCSLEDAADMLIHEPTDRLGWSLVRRTSHALAGNSAMMGFDGVAYLARALERRAIEVETREVGADDVLTVDRGLEAMRILIASVRKSYGAEEH